VNTKANFPSRLARLIDFLTLERARVYALASLFLGCFIVFYAYARAPDEFSGGLDFPAFYNAGRILNEYPREGLYDRDLQHRLYLEIVPKAAPEGVNRYFGYAPFFALPFVPLAMLPFWWAFVCFTLTSLTLFTVGFFMVWKSAGLAKADRNSAFLIALSFLPFYAWCLLMGQTSAFGFFFFALGIYLSRTKPFASGLALALLTYKPPLLVLTVPMLFVLRRWRTLAGLASGSLALALLSFAIIGRSGLDNYLAMSKTFSQIKWQGQPTWLEVDAFSFLLPIVGPRVATGLLVAFALIVLAFLVKAWRVHPDAAYIHTITWTLVLNFYILLYDVTLIISAVVLSSAFLFKAQLPRSYRWLLLALFIVSWVEVDSARVLRFQPITLILIALGCYQLAASISLECTSNRADCSYDVFEGGNPAVKTDVC
jgi:Glycosyltransferase family 87